MDKRSISSKLNGVLGGRPRVETEDGFYIEGEAWKFCKENDHYLVSNMGRVISLKGKGRIMTQTIRHGYHYVQLCRDNKKSIKAVHRLVGFAFIDNPHNKETIDHVDGDKSNNTVGNLRWATYSENRKAYMKPREGSSSKYRGVTWSNYENRWLVSIYKEGNQRVVGRFSDEDSAAICFNEEAKKAGYASSALNIIKKDFKEIDGEVVDV